ncbi:glycosyl hydrolase family protein [Aureibaculum marinum]|uniref:Glycosyl hydrolase family protein n=1 Tax=Aureibaculum marinum TaxID=2487930 RepID=A0A3N4P3E5_9FLAO|nr:family 16 glycosylhydrolase [Aureibaculum marinum]RPD99100.1 glycosyl hydrolase family protein [Aureibaculum marinum]
MKITTLIILFFTFIAFSCSISESDEDTNNNTDNNPLPAETWITIPVPANPGNGMKWKFQANLSDNFEYEAPSDDKGDIFFDKWDDWYHNSWTGPAPTEWSRTHSEVTDGKLLIKASRPEGTSKTNTGIITSKKRVQYPVYIEARVKIMNSVLANGFWLLSPDDTQEIDIVEAYGSDRWTNEWFSPKRVHLSHHVFIRDPFQDWQPSDEGSFYTDGSTIWRDDFHRFGVYWKDPWNLEYYVDGKLVRTRSGMSEIDPLNYAEGTGLHKEMDIIINAEDQTWRAEQGLTPTDAELENVDNNTFKIDWIRVFKPVSN